MAYNCTATHIPSPTLAALFAVTDSHQRQALDASLELAALRPAGDSPWAPWAAQVAAAMRAAGVAFDPTQRQPLSPQRVQHDAIARYLQRIAAETASHTLLRHYFEEARGGSLTADSYGPAPYVQEVRRRALRQPVTRALGGRGHRAAARRGAPRSPVSPLRRPGRALRH